MDYSPLRNLKTDIEQHWRQFLPIYVADLEAEGCLETAIVAAAANTAQAVHLAIEAGADFETAWETYREVWAFLPPEPGTVDDGTTQPIPAEVVDDWDWPADSGWPPDDDNQRGSDAV